MLLVPRFLIRRKLAREREQDHAAAERSERAKVADEIADEQISLLIRVLDLEKRRRDVLRPTT